MNPIRRDIPAHASHVAFDLQNLPIDEGTTSGDRTDDETRIVGSIETSSTPASVNLGFQSFPPQESYGCCPSYGLLSLASSSQSAATTSLMPNLHMTPHSSITPKHDLSDYYHSRTYSGSISGQSSGTFEESDPNSQRIRHNERHSYPRTSSQRSYSSSERSYLNKRKPGSTSPNTEDRTDDAMTCSSRCTDTPPDRASKKQNHCEIEKRRRDKMNTYITELSRLIPVCGSGSRKLDKVTVLRLAVEHMRAIRGTDFHSYPDGQYKPACISDPELKNLIIQATDGFLFVVGCDRGRLLYVSESVNKVLNYCQSELLGKSWFDILHPKDLVKVKEQLNDLAPRGERLILDSRTMLPMKGTSLQHHWGSRLCPGARRAFFCRMKCKPSIEVKEEVNEVNDLRDRSEQAFPGQSPENNERKYSVVYCAGYLKPWPKSEKEDAEGDKMEDDDTRNLSCLTALGRILPSLRHTQLTSRLFSFSSRHATDGKFVFIDQSATLVLGFLPQELLGTSMYDFCHTDDVPKLAHVHKLVLSCSSSETPFCTPIYRFLTADSSYLVLQSTWNAFRNPFTRDFECLIATNTLIAGDDSNFWDLKNQATTSTPKDPSAFGDSSYISFLENGNPHVSTTSRGSTEGSMNSGRLVGDLFSPPMSTDDDILDLIPNYAAYTFSSTNENPIPEMTSFTTLTSSVNTSRQYKSTYSSTEIPELTISRNTTQSSVPAQSSALTTIEGDYTSYLMSDERDAARAGHGQSTQAVAVPEGNEEADMATLMSLLEPDSGTNEPSDVYW